MASNQISILRNNTIRAAAVLTTSYVASDAVNIMDCNQAMLFIDFTIGSLTSAELKFQFSHDNVSWYDETERQVPAVTADESIGALRVCVHQLSATSAKPIPVPLKAQYVRVMAKGTGTVTDSSLTLKLVAGVA